MQRNIRIRTNAALVIVLVYGSVGAQSSPLQSKLAATRRIVVQLELQRCEKTASQGKKCRSSSTLDRARKFEPLMAQAALKHHVDPRLLWTIAYLETRFQPESISPKGARGMMQFMPATGARYGLRTLQKMHDPNASIDAAARHLRELMRRFDDKVELTLAAYNAGEAAVIAYRSGQKLILPGGRIINPRMIRTNGVPPYAETLEYVARGQAVLKGLTVIFPPPFVARCQAHARQPKVFQQASGVDARRLTRSFYVVDRSESEERAAAAESLSSNSATGSNPN